MKNILYIDTANNTETIVRIEVNGDIYERKAVTLPRHTQPVLILIEQLLIESSLTLKDLTAIEVNTGPGSFTGLRVGITIANTMSQTLSIPLNGKLNHLVEPNYA